MNIFLGWVFIIIVAISVYFYLLSKKSLRLDHEEVLEKLFFKKAIVIIASVIFSTSIIVLLNTLLPSFFTKSETASINPFLIFNNPINNPFAILVGITHLIYPYLASVFKVQKNNDPFFKILFRSTLAYVSVVIAIKIGMMTVINR